MSHRVGVCQSCRTRFQIPATFAPNRAKCRSCGGVVTIGPPPGAADRSAAPAPRPPPRRAPERAVEAPAAVAERTATTATATATVEPSRPVASAPERKRKRGLLRALVFAGIAAVVAIGLWRLLA